MRILPFLSAASRWLCRLLFGTIFDLASADSDGPCASSIPLLPLFFLFVVLLFALALFTSFFGLVFYVHGGKTPPFNTTTNNTFSFSFASINVGVEVQVDVDGCLGGLCREFSCEDGLLPVPQVRHIEFARWGVPLALALDELDVDVLVQHRPNAPRKGLRLCDKANNCVDDALSGVLRGKLRIHQVVKVRKVFHDLIGFPIFDPAFEHQLVLEGKSVVAGHPSTADVRLRHQQGVREAAGPPW
mmetsp:Transcript_8123/g.17572  ORF Transcript_8123/g.17572 Transcript_8123/m.17572 type:complete len:244 (-) Transcript_8123:774-1505(-)